METVSRIELIADGTGMRAAFPDDFDTLASNQNARRRRRERLQPSGPDVSLPQILPMELPRRFLRLLQRLVSTAYWSVECFVRTSSLLI